MSNFKFNNEDRFDADKMMRSTVAQIHKGLPDKGGINLRTSYSKDKVGDPLNVSMFNLAEILMKAPAIGSPTDIMSHLETIVTGMTGTIYDEIKQLPGAGIIKNLLPDDLVAVVDNLHPDSTGKEDKDTKTDEGGGSTTGNVEAGDAKTVVSLARAELGYTETPPNTNRTKYHVDLGMQPGYWCAVFLMYLFKKAGIAQPQITPGCQLTYNNYAKLGRVSSSEPKVGALCFFQYPRNNQLNHIGLVIGFDETHITTIEGNTGAGSSGDQSNGGGVFEKKHSRTSKSLRSYAYPIYPALPTSPVAPKGVQ